MIYQSIVLPYFNYCNILWGNCAITHLNRLLVLQKRAVRAITNSPPRSSTQSLFIKLNLLSIYDINKYQIATFMYLFSHNSLPSFYNDLFVKNRFINNYITRQSDKFYLPNFRYNFSRTTIEYAGPILWNNLPNDLKSCPSLNSFKRKYKNSLINS